MPRLKSSLRHAKLIDGDICETAKTFLNDSVAPIGVMLIDVDVYRPTVAILDMLLEDDKYFLPEVVLYFDDLAPNWEFQGEALAIKEFNAKSENIKISPESTYDKWWWAVMMGGAYIQYELGRSLLERGMAQLKVASRFTHPKFAREAVPHNALFTG